MEVWLGAEAGGAGGGTDVPAFPRALPRRGTRRSVPVGVTDDLIFAVRGMPDQYRFVTARILSDRGCVSAAVVALMEAHTTSVLPEAVLLALPSEDCRFLLCESGRTLVVWLPEDAHADTQSVYRRAAPVVATVFPNVVSTREASHLCDFDSMPL